MGLKETHPTTVSMYSESPSVLITGAHLTSPVQIRATYKALTVRVASAIHTSEIHIDLQNIARDSSRLNIWLDERLAQDIVCPDNEWRNSHRIFRLSCDEDGTPVRVQAIEMGDDNYSAHTIFTAADLGLKIMLQGFDSCFPKTSVTTHCSTGGAMEDHRAAIAAASVSSDDCRESSARSRSSTLQSAETNSPESSRVVLPRTPSPFDDRMAAKQIMSFCNSTQESTPEQPFQFMLPEEPLRRLDWYTTDHNRMPRTPESTASCVGEQTSPKRRRGDSDASVAERHKKLRL
ncbi:hypothetical protein DL96DRAFT_1587509, partial [Flagelloscypha sp. PMI_526]